MNIGAVPEDQFRRQLHFVGINITRGVRNNMLRYPCCFLVLDDVGRLRADEIILVPSQGVFLTLRADGTPEIEGISPYKRCMTRCAIHFPMRAFLVRRYNLSM